MGSRSSGRSGHGVWEWKVAVIPSPTTRALTQLRLLCATRDAFAAEAPVTAASDAITIAAQALIQRCIAVLLALGNDRDRGMRKSRGASGHDRFWAWRYVTSLPERPCFQ